MRTPGRGPIRMILSITLTLVATASAACTGDRGPTQTGNQQGNNAQTEQPSGQTGGQQAPQPDGPGAPGTADPARPTLPTARPSTPAPPTRLTVETVASGIESPVDLTSVPGSTTRLVAERSGRVRALLVDDRGVRVAATPVIDLREEVGSAEGERGLLGLTVSPDGTRLYASYTAAADGASILAEYPLRADPGGSGGFLADRQAGRRLLRVPQPFPNHNGGAVRFGPDGLLYLALGDGGSAGDPQGNGQNPETLLGKILRIDPTPDSGRAVRIPADNPFAGGGGAPEVWALGLRNPWRFEFDASGAMWIADVGQNKWEEVNLLPAGPDGRGAGRGANLGWNRREGLAPFEGGERPPGSVDPVHVYSHDDGCSISGGAPVPTGPLAGWYLFGDFCEPGIRGIRVESGRVVDSRSWNADTGQTVGITVDGQGGLWVLSLDRGVLRVTVPGDAVGSNG